VADSRGESPFTLQNLGRLRRIGLLVLVGVTIVNLSVLKNARDKAVRFSTLTAVCDALECDAGEVLYLLR